MNMENFITVYPSRVFQIRNELLKVLGNEKCDIFFDSVCLFHPKSDNYLVSYRFYPLNPMQTFFKITGWMPCEFLSITVISCIIENNYFHSKSTKKGSNIWIEWQRSARPTAPTQFSISMLFRGGKYRLAFRFTGHAAFWDLMDCQNWVVEPWKKNSFTL